MDLEKAVNHGGRGEHSVKTEADAGLADHPVDAPNHKPGHVKSRRAGRVRGI